MKIPVAIAGHAIQEHGSVFIIAEAGVNHNGELSKALTLVDVAAAAGADAIKFQTFKAEQVVTSQGKMAEYQQKNTGKVTTQRQMLSQLELKEEFYNPIINRCREKNILFMSTPHGGKASVTFLETLDMPAYKIGSGDLTNYVLLNKIAKLNKPIILSTGMSTLAEVVDAVGFIKSKANQQIVVLHCTTSYPCPPHEVNLAAMVTMMNELDVPVGYSDHTIGHEVAVLATKLGAAMYECHFTLDKNLPGPDHICSADPQELKEKIRLIREQVIMGSPVKKPNATEITKMSSTVRRSLVAAQDLPKHHKITENDLEAKRPGTGTSPVAYELFIGKKLTRSLKKDEQIFLTDIN